MNTYLKKDISNVQLSSQSQAQKTLTILAIILTHNVVLYVAPFNFFYALNHVTENIHAHFNL